MTTNDMRSLHSLNGNEPTPTDARSKGRSKVYFDYALQEGRKWNIKPRAEGACTLCRGAKEEDHRSMAKAPAIKQSKDCAAIKCH